MKKRQLIHLIATNLFECSSSSSTPTEAKETTVEANTASEKTATPEKSTADTNTAVIKNTENTDSDVAPTEASDGAEDMKHDIAIQINTMNIDSGKMNSLLGNRL